MSRAHEIYPLERRLKNQLALADKDKHNAQSLIRYYKVRSTQVALATVFSDVYRLRILSEMFGKKFEDATLSDIEDLHYKICQRWKHPHTRNKFRKHLKQFYQWLEGYSQGEYPQRVKWIKIERIPLVSVTEDDLIPFDAALKICECADNLRDKALFTGKLDAGCRIGEILTVRVGEVQMTEYGAVLKSDGKTGPQPIILTWSTPYLTQWLNNHPFRDNPNVPLFVDLTRAKATQLTYAGARKAFKQCVQRAGIKKRVWLHLFKHISSSEDYNNGMPDSYRRFKHHWTQSSKMPEVYEHISQSIIARIQKDTWNRIPGTAKPELNSSDDSNPKRDLVRTCQRCKFENPSDSIFCNRCGFTIETNKAQQIAVAREMADDLLNKLTENPEKLEKLLALIEKE